MQSGLPEDSRRKPVNKGLLAPRYLVSMPIFRYNAMSGNKALFAHPIFRTVLEI